jgi:hypothetical protein
VYTFPPKTGSWKITNGGSLQALHPLPKVIQHHQQVSIWPTWRLRIVVAQAPYRRLNRCI